MKRRTQVFLVHGGMTFKSHKGYINYLKTREISVEEKVRWSGDYLKKGLGKDFEIIKPRMPLVENAKYKEWKLYFERYIPYFKDDIILIGTSLGGIFLAKYLSENRFPKRILSTYLVCPPYDNSLPGEDLVGGFRLGADLSLLERSTNNLYLMFSNDDEVVPISQAERFRKKLKCADIRIYEGKNGHFNVATFPEIVKQIKADVKRRRMIKSTGKKVSKNK